MSSLITDLSVHQLRRAAQIKENIQSLEKELGRLLGSSPSLTNLSNGDVSKKKLRRSAAVRAKMSAAAKARWAKTNGQKAEVKSPIRKVKRTFSAAAKAKMAAAAKARWAKVNAAGKKAL